MPCYQIWRSSRFGFKINLNIELNFSISSGDHLTLLWTSRSCRFASFRESSLRIIRRRECRTPADIYFGSGLRQFYCTDKLAEISSHYSPTKNTGHTCVENYLMLEELCGFIGRIKHWNDLKSTFLSLTYSFSNDCDQIPNLHTESHFNVIDLSQEIGFWITAACVCSFLTWKLYFLITGWHKYKVWSSSWHWADVGLIFSSARHAVHTLLQMQFNANWWGQV